MPEIELKNVSKKFDGEYKIKNLNLKVNDGEYITICGPTGSGKSTFLKLIAGIVDPDEGDILFNGKKMSKIPPEERGVGMVFEHQTYALFPHLTVLGNTIYGPRVKGGNLEEIQKIGMQMLYMVLLGERANAYPRECSGGMKQRVALARALMASKEINLILLDEPLSALDAKIRMALRFELMNLVENVGVTCIHVTQDTEEALMVSQRLIIMNQGEFIQEGTPMEIYENPKNLFVCRFISTCNFIEGVIETVKKDYSTVKLNNNTTIMVKNDKFIENDRIIVAIRAENLEILREKNGEMNQIQGKIINSKYVSGNDITEVRLETGNLFTSKKHAIKIWFKEGSNVYASFKPDRTILFPYPEEGLEKALEIK
ncbi:MAG: ABC transporter ATP-binding protein [Candidatus Lokiarchaeota archaeon]|nr:ABC transporter ATP-binding protein [Candidatus Lokiarchaeota archaeon]